MEDQQSNEVTKRLMAIRRRYPELKQLGASFMGNYQNANREVVNALQKMDSEIREPFIVKTYGAVQPFDQLALIGYLDTGITDYGDLLVEIRFCCGYIGNLAQGQVLGRNECAALMFAYECYWREGDDFLLGCVVENHLRRIPPPGDWGWPDDAKFKGSEEHRQLQWLAHTVAKEMKELARYHRLMQPGMDSFRVSEPTKPEQRDFLAILRQITQAAKGERKVPEAHRA